MIVKAGAPFSDLNFQIKFKKLFFFKTILVENYGLIYCTFRTFVVV